MDPKVLFSDGKPEVSNKKQVTCSQEKSTFVAINKERKTVCKITIDDYLIKSGQRCDYGLWVDDGSMFLIELKGSNTEEACCQIGATYDFFKKEYRAERFDYKFRIVCTKVNTAPRLQNKKQMLERRTNIKVKIKTTIMQEII